jgi:hypothetical protein
MVEKKDQSHLVAYCGLNCGQCHGYTGTIPDLVRDLRKELRQIHFDKFASFISTYSFGKDFKNYDECYKVLGAMVKFRCRKGCIGGGGSPFCKIRKCAQKKEKEGCWECSDFETCKKLQFLEPVHGDAHLKNLRIITKTGKKKINVSKLLWYHTKKD